MSVESYVQGLAKPKCACTFNGQYLEDVVPGYRTSYVEGRDSYEADLEELTSKRIHGARYRSMKERTRDLRIHFNLHANNEENYQKRCNAIRGFLLQNRQVKIIFNDESDVYYIGSAKSLQFSKFVNAYNSNCTMTIHCATPFKYSVQTFVEYPTMDPATEGGTDYTTFVVDYDGTWRAFPTFEVDFYSSDTPDDRNGDCGYVAFTNQNGRILQFGNPKETDASPDAGEDNTEQKTTKIISEALINQTFNNASKNYGWTVYNNLNSSNGNVRFMSVAKQDDNLQKDLARGGASVGTWGNSTVMKPTSYGSQSGWHYYGPYLVHNIPNDSNGDSGAVDWTLQCVHVLAAAASGKDKTRSRGFFEIVVHNGSRIIAGVSIVKCHDTTDFTVQLCINGNIVNSFTVDCSHNSTKYGFGKKASRTTSITKKGSSITFNIAGTKKTFKVDAVKNMSATKCQMAFTVRQNTRPAIKDNVVYSFKFTKNNITKSTTSETQNSENTFTTNDKLTIDCDDAYVYLGKQVTASGNEDPSLGEHAPELGALGNDWETFYLEPGINQIHGSYSEWVSSAYKPTFIMKYKKVYI